LDRAEGEGRMWVRRRYEKKRGSKSRETKQESEREQWADPERQRTKR